MRTAYITHPDCLLHDPGPHHPERAARLQAIGDQLIASGVMDLLRQVKAPLATDEQLERVHTRAYIARIKSLTPPEGERVMVDPDTWLSHYSVQAALRAAGAAVEATREVIEGDVDTAFCAVRPPGHHAERERAMGFCLFNNAAVAAAHALDHYGLERVAITDFDVHHGNGTEAIFQDDSRVLYCSTFQHPFYPNRPLPQRDHLIQVPLEAGAYSEAFQEGISRHWLPALERFRPQLIVISAGFDGHFEDEMAGLNLLESDYAWVTRELMKVAERHAENRVVSILEGGYELGALARSTVAHIRMLMGIGLAQGVAGPR